MLCIIPLVMPCHYCAPASSLPPIKYVISQEMWPRKIGRAQGTRLSSPFFSQLVTPRAPTWHSAVTPPLFPAGLCSSEHTVSYCISVSYLIPPHFSPGSYFAVHPPDMPLVTLSDVVSYVKFPIPTPFVLISSGLEMMTQLESPFFSDVLYKLAQRVQQNPLTFLLGRIFGYFSRNGMISFTAPVHVSSSWN